MQQLREETKAEKAALQEEKGRWLEDQNSYWKLEHEKLQEEKSEYGRAKKTWEEERDRQLQVDWAKLNEEREQMSTERDLWHEERERLKNIDMFKLQVERDKLSEEKEAFQIEKNIHGFTTASDILDLRVDPRTNAMKSVMKSAHFPAMLSKQFTFHEAPQEETNDYSPKKRPRTTVGAGRRRDKYDLV